MNYKDLMQDSPVEKLRKELPRGKADWKAFDYVYTRLQKAAHYLAKGKNSYLSDDHVKTMAVMGCGDEETMKAWLMVCRNNGWIK